MGINPTTENRGSNEYVLIRFTYPAKTKQKRIIYGPATDPESWTSAAQAARRIEGDILLNQFDESLVRYRKNAVLTKETVTSKEQLIHKLEERQLTNYSVVQASLIAHLSKYDGALGTRVDCELFVNWLLQKMQPTSARRYLETLRVIAPDGFRGIVIRGAYSRPPRAFSLEEVISILKEFKQGNYSGCYYPYVAVCFLAGLRTSEAIGLRRRDVDLQHSQLVIYSCLRRASNKSSLRERAPTKNNKGRHVPLSPRLQTILVEYMSQLSPSQELLFLTNKGTPINDRNFSRREWRDCLKNVGIDYEPRRTNPYAMRHTFITHQLENGVPPHKLARITGHQVKVLLEKYACVLDPNEPLKDFL